MDKDSEITKSDMRDLKFAVILLIFIFTVCIAYPMSRPLQPVEVEFVASEGYRASSTGRFSTLQTYYVHYYQGIVDGELVTFTDPDRPSSKGHNRTILVNLENPSEYEMFSSKHIMLLYLLALNIPIIIIIICCIWLLIVFRNCE